MHQKTSPDTSKGHRGLFLSVVAGLLPKELGKDTDLNTVTTTGNYLYTTSGNVSVNELHSPSINNGQIFVVANNGYIIQYANDQSFGLYYRSKTDRLTWSPWRQLQHD